VLHQIPLQYLLHPFLEFWKLGIVRICAGSILSDEMEGISEFTFFAKDVRGESVSRDFQALEPFTPRDSLGRTSLMTE